MPGPWDFTAASLYGGAPSPQPTATNTVDHAPGTPEPMARTVARPVGVRGDATLVLVGMLGLAALLMWRTG
ncbi:MAG: hypothetical protein ACRDZ3_20860 [Acidimicrobiia bacterium]